jgi:hypothetical protein
VRARWVATAIASALMLSCYGLIGRADAYLAKADWKFSRSDEPQKFWQIDLSYWKHFCSVENRPIGANAAIRGNDTDTKSVDSLFFRQTAPYAVRFERCYSAPAFSLVFFRRRECVGRTFQRVFWSPTLRAGELAGVDGCVDHLLKPIVRIFVISNVYSRNTVDQSCMRLRLLRSRFGPRSPLTGTQSRSRRRGAGAPGESTLCPSVDTRAYPVNHAYSAPDLCNGKAQSRARARPRTAGNFFIRHDLLY